MTRLERKEAELAKLNEYKFAAMRKNDLVWLTKNQKKIEELEKEIAKMEKLSSKIATFVLLPKAQTLEDFIVDNDEVVKGCIILADRYLNDKLNL